jgi:hypothetical protein
MIKLDRKRWDSESHCNGFVFSPLCSDVKSSEIVRVDRDLVWQLSPDKKSYLETPFSEQQKMRETLDKNLQYSRQQVEQRSHCDLSPSRVEMRQTDEHATIAGHDARKASVKNSQTCANKETGDACELFYGFDVWLSQDQLEWVSDQLAFQHAYMTKMGLDSVGAPQDVISTQLMELFDRAQFLLVMTQAHMVKDTVREMAAKLAPLQGYPLRVTFRFITGGDSCPATQPSDSDSADNNAVGKLFGGLFGKMLGGLSGKNATPGAPDASQGADAANAPPPMPDGYKQILAYSVETTAVSTDAISPDQFELPVGWARQKLPPIKGIESPR